MTLLNTEESTYPLSKSEVQEIEKYDFITTSLQLAARLTGLQILGLRQSQPIQWLGYMERRNVQLDFKEDGLISSHLNAFDELIGDGAHEVFLGPLDPEDDRRKLICRLNSFAFFGIPIYNSDGHLFGSVVGMTEFPIGRLEIIEIRKSLKLFSRLISSVRLIFESSA